MSQKTITGTDFKDILPTVRAFVFDGSVASAVRIRFALQWFLEAAGLSMTKSGHDRGEWVLRMPHKGEELVVSLTTRAMPLAWRIKTRLMELEYFEVEAHMTGPDTHKITFKDSSGSTGVLLVNSDSWKVITLPEGSPSLDYVLGLSLDKKP